MQKLKLTSKQGDTSYFYFDASTGLIHKWEGTRKVKDCVSDKLWMFPGKTSSAISARSTV